MDTEGAIESVCINGVSIKQVAFREDVTALLRRDKANHP